MTGYDDLEIADYVGLTTIHQSLAAMGEHAVTRLLGLIGRKDAGPLRDVLPVSLVVRTTTGAPGG